MAILRLVLILMFVATPLAADVTVRVAAAVPPSDLTSAQKVLLDATSAALLKGDTALAQKHWSDFSADYFKTKEKQAALPMIADFVLKNGVLPKDPEAPKRSLEIEKKQAALKALETVKSKGKEYLLKLKQFKALNEPATISELQIKYDRDGVPSLLALNAKQLEVAQIDLEIARWEEQMETLEEDSQLQNADLQDASEKMKETLDMILNILKLLSDTANSIIQNLK